MSVARVNRDARSKIDYVVTCAGEPMTTAETEQLLRLVGKIVADVYIREINSCRNTEHSLSQ